MDENQTTPDVNELQAECQWLRRQVQITLALLVVVSATLTMFLFKQVRELNGALSSLRTANENYQKGEGAMTDELLRQLSAYGRTHPDFNAIYTKYGLNQATNLPPAPKK
jgi:hypothetical protein